MTRLVGRIFAASLGVALAAGTVQGQSITGLGRGRKPSPAELLAELQGQGTVVEDSLSGSRAALEETVEAVVVTLGQSLKTHVVDYLTPDQVVALKVATLHAESDVRDVAGAVASGKLPASEGRARIVKTLSDYCALVRELHPSTTSSSAGAERR